MRVAGRIEWCDLREVDDVAIEKQRGVRAHDASAEVLERLIVEKVFEGVAGASSQV